MKAARVVAAFVALQHLAFLVLEMFLWTRPIGRAVFKTTPEQAAATAQLAMNQGLYNGFLAAGLIWGLLADEPAAGRARLRFFFGCVLAAGLFGGATVDPGIALVQGAPALMGLGLLLRART